MKAGSAIYNMALFEPADDSSRAALYVRSWKNSHGAENRVWVTRNGATGRTQTRTDFITTLEGKLTNAAMKYREVSSPVDAVLTPEVLFTNPKLTWITGLSHDAARKIAQYLLTNEIADPSMEGAVDQGELEARLQAMIDGISVEAPAQEPAQAVTAAVAPARVELEEIVSQIQGFGEFA